MRDLATKCLAEALATFLLVFIGAGAVVADAAFDIGGLLAVALANGLILSVAVSATMHVSGAHINPAVTLLMLATGRVGPVAAAAYIPSQLLGATVAAAVLLAIFQGIPGGGEAIAASGLGATTPGAGVPAATALLTEVVLAFILVFVIFGTVVDARAPSVAGFGIGLVVASEILVGGPISGASMNPARSFGPALVGGVWDAHWVYWTGPMIGVAMSGLLYHHVILGGRDS